MAAELLLPSASPPQPSSCQLLLHLLAAGLPALAEARDEPFQPQKLQACSARPQHGSSALQTQSFSKGKDKLGRTNTPSGGVGRRVHPTLHPIR